MAEIKAPKTIDIQCAIETMGWITKNAELKKPLPLPASCSRMVAEMAEDCVISIAERNRIFRIMAYSHHDVSLDNLFDDASKRAVTFVAMPYVRRAIDAGLKNLPPSEQIDTLKAFSDWLNGKKGPFKIGSNKFSAGDIEKKFTQLFKGHGKGFEIVADTFPAQESPKYRHVRIWKEVRSPAGKIIEGESLESFPIINALREKISDIKDNLINKLPPVKLK